MTMTIVVTRNAAERTRGFLASCMCEIAAGVFTAPRMNAAVRERVWKVLEEWFDATRDESIVMTWPEEDLSGGQDVRALGCPRWELVELDGCYLARREVQSVDAGSPAALGPAAVVDSRRPLILDLETTGLGGQAEPVEIAVLAADETVVFTSLIRPSRGSGKLAQTIHCIPPGDLESARPFAVVAEEISKVLAGATVFAFNADFDRAVLERAFRRVGRPLPDIEWSCALDAYERARGVRCSLAAACQAEGIAVSTLHRAEADALLTVKLLRELGSLTTDD